MTRSFQRVLPRLSQNTFHSSPPDLRPMEVEVKLRLPDSAAHQKLSDLLSPYHTKTHLQQNLFFDTPSLTLATNHLAALRLRFYDLDSQSFLSLKAKPVISSGISRIEEDEEPLEPAVARACAAEPRLFSAIESQSRILKRVKEEFGVDAEELVGLGGFRNVRAVHEWNGLKVELDETQYDFGVNYEIECESDDPERAKMMLEELLNQNEIGFWYSQMSKFAIFRSGKLPEFKEKSAGGRLKAAGRVSSRGGRRKDMVRNVVEPTQSSVVKRVFRSSNKVSLDSLLEGNDDEALPWDVDHFDDQSAFFSSKLRQHQSMTAGGPRIPSSTVKLLLLFRGLVVAGEPGLFQNDGIACCPEGWSREGRLGFGFQC